MAPLQLDPQAAAKITAKSLETYRKASVNFANWLVENELDPETAEQWDDLLVEFKWAHPRIPKTTFGNLVAAVEFFFPVFKHKLAWSHHIITGWSVEHQTKHTIPMLSSVAALYGVHFTALGHPRLGAGIYIQQSKGLRPSEMLALERQDVMLPEDAHALTFNAVVVSLGTKVGTKAKRAQAVVFDVARFPICVELFRRLCAVTNPGEKLFPYSLEQYNRLIKKVSKVLGIEDIGYSGHSPRAGFASEGRAMGKEFVELREEGRWVADTSLRIYIDVVAASTISLQLTERRLKPALVYAVSRLLDYCTSSAFSFADGTQEGHRGKKGGLSVTKA